jgi:hypothetical protein
MTAARGGTGRSRWERFAPAGAIGFLLTVALGALAVGEGTPASDAPAPEIAAYFAEHSTGMLFNTTLVVFGGFALYPWFLASLWRAIRRAEGQGGICATVALIAGVALLGPLLFQAAAWGAASLEAGPNRDPSVAVALMDLGNMGFLLVAIPAGLLIAATSAGAWSGVIFPRWLARAGVPLAAVLILGGVLAPGLAPIYFALFALWLVVVAIGLMRPSRPTRPVEA